MSADEQNYEKLKTFALGQGIDLFGVAEAAPIQDTFHIEPPKSVADLTRGVSMAVRLSGSVIDNLVDRPHEVVGLVEDIAFGAAVADDHHDLGVGRLRVYPSQP